MKKILTALALFVALEVKGATFEFKDGTRVNGTILESPYKLALGDPNTLGIVLKVNNRIYMHHYPEIGYRDNGDGTYSPIPTLAPPDWDDANPKPLPSCVPSRIAFFYFSNRTLKDLYTYYFNRTKYYTKNGNHTESKRNKDIALAVYAALYGRSPIRFRKNSKGLHEKWVEDVEKHFGKNPTEIVWDD